MNKQPLRERLQEYRDILHNPGFRLLFLGQTISQFGDWMNRVALLVLAYRLAGPGLATALILLAQLLPRVIVSPFGGLLADRYPKRSLMIALDLLRAGLAASLVIAERTNLLWLAGGSVLVLHGLAAVFNPARNAIIPGLVPSAGLPIANALNTLSGQAAFFLGPAIGGGIAALWGLNAVFLINAGSFILSALCIWGIRMQEPPIQPATNAGIIAPLRAGWQAMQAQAFLRLALGALFLESVIAIGVTIILLPFLAEPLAAPAEQLGTLLTAVGLGTIVGTPLGLWLFERYQVLRLTLGAVFGLILSLLLLGLANTLVTACAALFLNGIFTGITDLIVVTSVQRTVSAPRLGRAFGLMFWIVALGQVAGAIGGSIALEFLNARNSLLVLAVGCAVITLILLLDLRRRTTQSLPAEPTA